MVPAGYPRAMKVPPAVRDARGGRAAQSPISEMLTHTPKLK